MLNLEAPTGVCRFPHFDVFVMLCFELAGRVALTYCVSFIDLLHLFGTFRENRGNKSLPYCTGRPARVSDVCPSYVSVVDVSAIQMCEPVGHAVVNQTLRTFPFRLPTEIAK